MNYTDMTIGQLYAARLELNECIERIEEAARASLVMGIPYPGFELKPGRKMREVPQEPELIQACIALGIPKQDLVSEKFVGVPAFEKAIKVLTPEEQKDLMDTYVKIKETKPSLVYTGEYGE